MDDNIRIIKSLNSSGVWPDGVSKKTVKHDIKRQDRFLGMLLGPLGASVLGSMSTG